MALAVPSPGELIGWAQLVLFVAGGGMAWKGISSRQDRLSEKLSAVETKVDALSVAVQEQRLSHALSDQNLVAVREDLKRHEEREETHFEEFRHRFHNVNNEQQKHELRIGHLETVANITATLKAKGD